jgi:hypothetical protein
MVSEEKTISSVIKSKVKSLINKDKTMFHKALADGFFIFASIAVLAAVFGWAVEDMWLASTQWLEVAIVFYLIAIYTKLSEDEDLQILKERHTKNKKYKKRKSSKK